MLVTEEQAATKWCPHAREICDNSTSANRDYRGNPMSKCVGANCMAWRWADSEVQITTTYWAKDADEEKPEGEGWEPTSDPERSSSHMCFERRWKRIRPGRLGSCGLHGETAYP